ncbi:hypothetical protein [Heyndrickxia sporothermodurans]|uniref:hypothetical protein n=1 Tax=Heyndrickxia sporothermodurans TaxID=46224 RepID=UPI000D3B5E85|nr:hypothetical protein [Heyndrickxia sporothermodurans]PTY89751.1 hypothetical protein B5V90_07480 [Heyndrickxia sporothermodurans]
MSLQTVEQQMGYILKAIFETNLPVKEFEKAKKILPDLFEEDGIFDNDTGLQALRLLADQLDTIDYKKARSELYYLYDMKTVQEAGGFYEVYMLGKPMKSIDQLYEEQPVLYHQTEMKCFQCGSHDDVIDFVQGDKEHQLCSPCRTKMFMEGRK